jgi:hypothetical protein
MSSKAVAQPLQTVEAHPFAMAIILGLLALTGAGVFAGSVWMWMTLRNTGVDWMFSTVR